MDSDPEEDVDMDPNTPAGLPSSSQIRMDVTRTGLPRSASNLSRSAATSTASLASSAGSERSSGNVSVVAGTPAPGIHRSGSTTDVLNSHAETLSIGDAVFVNGNKAGVIRFIGTTSFAPGKWAGVELDEEKSGKNDGSVSGVRYFECLANKGIFVRPYRCTLEPMAVPLAEFSRPVSPADSAEGGPEVTKDELKVKTTTSLSTTTSSTPAVGKKAGGTAVIGSLRMGMRVIVNASSGHKVGTISYLGPVDFAPGAWVGVELDVAAGKNDGTVAGKRYFSCQPNFGLFAPLNKVQKYTDISTIPLTGGPSNVPVRRLSTSSSSSAIPARRVGASSSLSTAGRKTGACGSQESLSSVTSSFSTKSGSSSRIRLGVTSLSAKQGTAGINSPAGGKVASGGKPVNGRSAASGATGAVTATNALRDAISEKEEHISQLLRERDMERGEVARAAAKAEEIESRLASLQTEHRKLLHQKEEELTGLRRSLSQERLVQKGLSERLDEEKRKLEVLEFRLEEEIVTRMELKDELDRVAANSSSSGRSDASPAAARDRSASMQSHSETQHEEEMFQLQEDVLRKDERIFELEHSLDSRKTEVANLQKRVKEFENQVKLFDERQKNYLTTIDDLNLKIKKVEDQNRKFEQESVKYRDVKRKLEDQVSELIGISGDNSGQLSDLKADLRAKTDEVDSLRVVVAKLTREVDTSREAFKRLENNLQTELREKERRIEDLLISDQHLNIEIEKREDIIKHLEDKIDDLISSTGSNTDHLAELNQESKQKGQEIKRLEEEVFKLRNQIDQMDRSQERASEENENMRKLISTREQEITTYSQQEIELKDKISYLEESITRVKKQNSEDLKSKDREREQLEHRVEELLTASGDSGAQLLEMNDQLNQQKETNAKLTDELRSLKEHLAKMEKDKSSAEHSIEDMRKTLQTKDNLIKDQESKINDLEASVKALSEEREETAAAFR